MEFITVECMNFMPHEAHSWREGFLWHRKRKCGGVPKISKPDWLEKVIGNYCQADVELTMGFFEKTRDIPHRHHYRFVKEQSDQLLMIWKCEVPGCNDHYSKFRSLFNLQTRVRSARHDLHWLWR